MSQIHDEAQTRHVVAGVTTYAAAAVLLVTAALTILQGISALVDDKLVVVTPDYVYEFNTTVWGAVHVVIGLLFTAVAFGLFWSATWARAAAIIMAALSIVSMFMWMPHAPVWSIVTIALDIVVIWAVATWESPRSRVKREHRR
ncbi:MAG: hypothetical protein U0R81_03855 [Mycobacterium sp.]